VLSRWPGLTALAAAALVLAGCGWALSGCGSVVTAAEATGNQLTIYSGLPLQGPTASISRQIEGGEKLALSQADGHIGPFRVSYVSLDDANPKNGQPSPGETATAAKEAAKDTSTIAYIGDYDSAATAVSLPIINEAGILQVSPASPYVGLTSSLDAGQDEPERFYPSGRRNFARLLPGDPVQAAAQAQLMQMLGVHKVYVLDDQTAFEMPLAAIVAGDAARDGIDVVAHDSIQIEEGTAFKGEVEKIIATHAQAVFLAGGPGIGTARLWKELHQAEPHLLLLGSSGMDSEEFTSRLGSAASVTYLTTPLLAQGLYPPSAQRVLSEYRTLFGSGGGPSVLYGYEAMSAVLEAIRRAGPHGNDRPDVIREFMSMRNRSSVLGTYSIRPNGETTLSTYGVDRVAEGRPVFYREIQTERTGAGV
jgi:branched-chain amino acid transport system substrate-binding protein